MDGSAETDVTAWWLALDAGRARKPKPLDPALAAAKILIEHATAEIATSTVKLGADGSVALVCTQSAGWSELARNAWELLVRPGEQGLDGPQWRHRRSERWVAWLLTEPPRAGATQEANKDFAEALAAEKHCAGFCHDPSWLPSDLVYAADHRLKLPPLRGEDVEAIAAELCGSVPRRRLPDEDAEALTPRLLRLARRPGQSADGYTDKLSELLARDRGSSPPRAGGLRNEPTLERLHGMPEAVEWGTRLARDLAAVKSGELGWSAVDRGCLVSGPPGCGKTMFARALAASCQIPLVSGSYGRWHGSGNAHQGDLLKGMARTFSEARAAAPCILFIDEIDSFPDRSRIVHHYADWEIQVVNSLLAEIDGVEQREGVVLVGACNFPDKLDPALLRSGRLDRHIRIGLPDTRALERIFAEHLGGDLDGVPLSGAALAAVGATGADCERIVRQARRRARLAERAMELQDLLSEVGGDDRRAPEALRLAAVHEAGHCLAAVELMPGVLLAATLRGGGGQGGATLCRWEEGFVRARGVRARLVFLLAGRAAEEIVFGEPSSGAGGSGESDLALATRAAVHAASALGLGGAGGLVWSGKPDTAEIPEILAGDPELRSSVGAALADAYADALGLVRKRVNALEALAAELVERRTLAGCEIVGILSLHPIVPEGGRTGLPNHRG